MTQHDLPPLPPLTREDLAEILSDDGVLDDKHLEWLAELARTDPRLSPIYQELEAIARDYGETKPTAFSTAVMFNEMVDKLVEAKGWRHPDEVLKSHDKLYDEYLDVLIEMIGARAERAEHPKALLAIKRKLERAYRAFKKRHGIED